MSKIDDYASKLLSGHIQAVAKEDGLDQKFMKGFMDVEFDPFVVVMEGDDGWKIYPCGSKYAWLDNNLLLQIEEWIESVREDYDASIAEQLEEIDRELSQ